MPIVLDQSHVKVHRQSPMQVVTGPGVQKLCVIKTNTLAMSQAATTALVSVGKSEILQTCFVGRRSQEMRSGMQIGGTVDGTGVTMQ